MLRAAPSSKSVSERSLVIAETGLSMGLLVGELRNASALALPGVVASGVECNTCRRSAPMTKRLKDTGYLR